MNRLVVVGNDTVGQRLVEAARPRRLRRFTSFVNAPDAPDPSITFEVERGRPAPALAERRPVALGLPTTLGVRR
ncbi:hypothetical protein ACN27F_22135 [Solwaraspora sp. WMMB335]|uniref:hypothetical protein n=1 Tax=Solwaraspora sp. WMMB335 TaxID=3404118 RepID=UPI003B950827